MASWVVTQSYAPRSNFEATQTTGACKFQAFLFQFGFIASLCFNCALAIIYLLMVKYSWTGQRLARAFRPAAVGIWIMAFVLAVIPLALNWYHEAGANCWIMPPPSDEPQCQNAESFAQHPECGDRQDVTSLLIVLQVLPTWIVILVNASIMFIIYKQIRQWEHQTKHRTMQQNNQTNAFFGVRPSEIIQNANSSCVHDEQSMSQVDDDDDDDSGEHSLGHDEHHVQKNAPTQYPEDESKNTQQLSWRSQPVPLAETNEGESKKANNPVIFDQFGRISHSKLEPTVEVVDDENSILEQQQVKRDIRRNMLTPKYSYSWRRQPSAAGLQQQDTNSSDTNKNAVIFDDFGRIVNSELEPAVVADPEVTSESTHYLDEPQPNENDDDEEEEEEEQQRHFQYGIISTKKKSTQNLRKSTRNLPTSADRKKKKSSTGTRSIVSGSAAGASRNRSRIVAVQGIWYISGFFFSYLAGTIAVVVYQTSGSWIVPLFQAGYFFLALQGAWNFLVFSRGRREMKTYVGEKVKALIWDTRCCCRCCSCCCRLLLPKNAQSGISSTPVLSGITPPTSGTTPGQVNLPASGGRNVEHSPLATVEKKISDIVVQRDSDQRNISDIVFMRESGGGRSYASTGNNHILSNVSTEAYSNNNRGEISFVSNASTVVMSNRNGEAPRASVFQSVAEDPEGIQEDICV